MWKTRNFSLLKFSRNFFTLFLGVTVLPVLALLIWSNYDLEQNLHMHQKQFLEMDANRITHLFHQFLNADMDEMGRIAKSLSPDTTLKDYQGIFNATEIWWLDSQAAKNFLKAHLENAAPFRRQRLHDVYGNYFLQDRSIQSFFIVPLNSPHHGVLLVKNIPPEFLIPGGPYRVEVFSGDSIQATDLIFKASFRRSHPRVGHGFGEQPHFGQSPHGPGIAPISGPGFGLPPPQEISDRTHQHCGREVDPNSPEKIVRLNDRTNHTLVTMRLKALRPPPPSGYLWLNRSEYVGLIILLTGMVTSLLAGNYILKNFIAPLTNLSLATRKVQDGDLSTRVETSNIRQADVRQTLENFNTMLSELSEKEQLRHSFISNLTHDFRTPLIAQRRSLEILSEEFRQRGLREQESLANSILRNSEHLLVMVNQLLEIYQSEADSFKLNPTPVMISRLVSQCFEQLAPLAEERSIGLHQHFPDDFPGIMGDADYLKRVFINLIGNAIENIPKASRIDITGVHKQAGVATGSDADTDMVEIHVKDNGPGISMEAQQHLFDRYYAGMGDTRKLGSGLGLYICAVLIAAHRGKIAIDSVEGQYTDFIIYLPVKGSEQTHE